MPDDQSDNKSATTKLLRRLSSAEAGAAWVEFLDLYTPLIMSTAVQFEYEHDRIDECFLHVCSQLNDNGFRRLLKYNAAGKASFRTWLGSVVFNLCVDWHRQEYGRATLLPAISALPAFDQSVYRMVIEQGMGKESCFQSLLADFPDLTRELVANAVARIYLLLTPRQRWQISLRKHRRKQTRDVSCPVDPEQLPSPEVGPEVEAQKQQELEALQQAMSELPSSQQLLLRLRFQEGLPLRKLAELKSRGDVNVIWRQIQAALDSLFQCLANTNPADKRKN